MLAILQVSETRLLTPRHSLTGALIVTPLHSVLLQVSIRSDPVSLDLKYDNCGAPSSYQDEYNGCDPDSGNPNDFPNGTCVNLQDPAPPGYDWSTSNTALRYQAMRDALQGVKRTILFSLCDWGLADVNEWGAKMGSSWRMSYDIRCMQYSIHLARVKL